MNEKNDDAMQGRVNEHSLPGTNQAGRGATVREGATAEGDGSRDDEPQGRLEEHSLPGTNQAGKGARPRGQD